MENKREELIDLFGKLGIEDTEKVTMTVADTDVEKTINILKRKEKYSSFKLQELIITGVLPNQIIRYSDTTYPAIFISDGNKFGVLSIYREYGFQVSGDEKSHIDLGSSYGAGNMTNDVDSLCMCQDDYAKAVIQIAVSHVIMAVKQSNMYDTFIKSLEGGEREIITEWFADSLNELWSENISNESMDYIDLMEVITNFISKQEYVLPLSKVGVLQESVTLCFDEPKLELIAYVYEDMIKLVDITGNTYVIDTYYQSEKRVVDRLMLTAQYMLGIDKNKTVMPKWVDKFPSNGNRNV